MQTICSFHFWCSSQIPMITQIFNIIAMATQKPKKTFDKNACGGLSENSWHVNPILQILALSEKHPKIWDGACLEIHLTSFLNNKLGIVGDRKEAGAIWIPSTICALSEQAAQTDKKEGKKTNRQKWEKKHKSLGLTKGWCWCSRVGQAASRPALQWSIPSQDCNVVPLSWLQPGGDNIAVIMITRLMIIITIITVWLLSSSVLSLVSRLSTCICTHCTLYTPHTVSIFTLLLTNRILELHTRRE